MKMLRNLILCIIILSLLFSLTCFVYAQETVREVDDIRVMDDSPFTDEQLKEILDNTQPIGPEYLKRISEDENTFAVYGEIPVKKEEEAYDWWISMQKIARLMQVDSSFKKYLGEHGGPVSGFGVSADGYMTIYVFPDSKDFSEQDILKIKKIVDQYASLENIDNLPLVFYYSDLDFELLANYSDYVRPIKGGHEVAGKFPNGSYMRGTIGYPAARNNNSNSKGIVTAAHVIPFNVSSSIYQPNASSNTYLLSNVTDNQTRIDAIFVPFNNVEPKIYVGNDSVLNSYSRSNANKSYMVVYGTSGINTGMSLNRYGGITGNSAGFLKEYIYNKSFNGIPNKSIDTIGVMQTTSGSNGYGGDSGGPVYVGMNVTIGTNTDYQAIAVGTIFAHNSSYQGVPVIFYAPVGEIDYYLNVKPIYSRNTVLT